jgi:hypothetical protein
VIDAIDDPSSSTLCSGSLGRSRDSLYAAPPLKQAALQARTDFSSMTSRSATRHGCQFFVLVRPAVLVQDGLRSRFSAGWLNWCRCPALRTGTGCGSIKIVVR